MSAKRRILWAFRELQRCRKVSEWDDYCNLFQERVHRVVETTSASFESVWGYFEDNWFTDDWRDLWTDLGIPAGANRDGMLNTNNWIERAFKTFDTIFLDFRANKRLDRLVIILANEFFPYFAEWEPTHVRRDRKARREILLGHRIWADPGQIVSLPGQNAWHIKDLQLKDEDDSSSGSDDETMIFVRVQQDQESGALSCVCSVFRQTGRSCSHIWAVRLSVGNGDVGKYLEHETFRAITGQAAKGQQSRQVASQHRPGVRDCVIDKESAVILEDIEKRIDFTKKLHVPASEVEEEEEEEDDAAASKEDNTEMQDPLKDVEQDIQFGFPTVGRLPGIQALHPGRTPSNKATKMVIVSHSPPKKKSKKSKKESKVKEPKCRFNSKPGAPARPHGSLLPAPPIMEHPMAKEISQAIPMEALGPEELALLSGDYHHMEDPLYTLLSNLGINTPLLSSYSSNENLLPESSLEPKAGQNPTFRLTVPELRSILSSSLCGQWDLVQHGIRFYPARITEIDEVNGTVRAVWSQHLAPDMDIPPPQYDPEGFLVSQDKWIDLSGTGLQIQPQQIGKLLWHTKAVEYEGQHLTHQAKKPVLRKADPALDSLLSHNWAGIVQLFLNPEQVDPQDPLSPLLPIIYTSRRQPNPDSSPSRPTPGNWMTKQATRLDILATILLPVDFDIITDYIESHTDTLLDGLKQQLHNPSKTPALLNTFPTVGAILFAAL
ncbi:hypothetical protein FRB99_002935, partial [Tulasnella sp. 403]